MTATITSQLQHRWFLVLRIALFALGGIFILGALITGAYQVGPDTHYTDIITSGLTGAYC